MILQPRNFSRRRESFFTLCRLLSKLNVNKTKKMRKEHGLQLVEVKFIYFGELKKMEHKKLKIED